MNQNVCFNPGWRVIFTRQQLFGGEKMSLFVNKSAELTTESGPHCSDISALNTAGVSCFSLQIHFLFFWTLLNSFSTCSLLQLNNRLFWQHMLVGLCVKLMFLYIPHVVLVSFSLHVIWLNLVTVLLPGPLFLCREVPLLRRNCWLLTFLVCLPNGKTFPPCCLKRRNWKFILDLWKQNNLALWPDPPPPQIIIFYGFFVKRHHLFKKASVQNVVK